MGNLEYCKMTEEEAIEVFKYFTGRKPTKADIDSMDIMRFDLVEYYKSVIKKCDPKKCFAVFLWRKKEFDKARELLRNEGFFNNGDVEITIRVTDFGKIFVFSAREEDLDDNEEFFKEIELNGEEIFKMALDLEFGNV